MIGSWRLALVAVGLAAALGGGLYVAGLRGEVARLTTHLDQVVAEREEARRVAQANADTLATIRAEAARQLAAVTDTLTMERRLRAQFVDIREEIIHVPAPAEVCPVDPALLRAVERLRR